MYIAILGRLSAISMAELEQIYGSSSTRWFSDTSALVDASELSVERLGGTQKAGRVTIETSGDWRRVSTQIVNFYHDTWSSREGKITLGISAYGFNVSPRDIQKTGIILKSKLRESGVSLRLIPNADSALNTATSHHNKLGLSDNHVELLVVRSSNGKIVVAESVGAQNITALAARDQARPYTDAFVGMLPPKLARIMLNLSGVTSPSSHAPVILDPFCGTGVILQEALLDGYSVHGSDLSDKMIDYTTKNLDWLKQHFRTDGTVISVVQGDAMTHQWSDPKHIDAVVSETYLGQPFSAPPRPEKLVEVRGNCNHIIGAFLSNIAPQLAPGTMLVLAVPAWRGKDGSFTHLPLARDLSRTGFQFVELTHATRDQLLYYRENQVVARELLLLVRS